MGAYRFSAAGSFLQPRTVHKSMRAGFISLSLQYLVIAGGGGAGIGAGGGGGAGGYRSNVTGELSGANSTAESPLSIGTQIILGTNYTVTIGAGGAGSNSVDVRGNSGANSVFSTITSSAGGFGSAWNNGPGGGGGSGGGGSNSAGGGGTENQGFAGGANGGGGGGASEAGNTDGAAAGGDGLESSITGTPVFRAGGGGGGGGVGGTGGGANGNSGSGVANTGGGGGGSQSGPQGNGGSGVVILRYASAFTITLGPGLSGNTASVGSDKVTTITSGTGNVSWAA